MARQMITRYGMSEALGPATFEAARTALYLPDPMANNRGEYSEETARVIDEEVRKLLLGAQERARETLSARREDLSALAQALLREESIDRARLTALLSGGATSNLPPPQTERTPGVPAEGRPAAA